MFDILDRDTATAIGLLGIIVSILLPFMLRTIDYGRHVYRSWRQTSNIRRIVRDGIRNMLNDDPPAPKKTDSGSVGDPVKKTADVIDAARYFYFEDMMFNLQVALDYHSSDLSYAKKRDVKHICEKLSVALSAWHRGKGKFPTKDVYEKFVIEGFISGKKWLKAG